MNSDLKEPILTHHIVLTLLGSAISWVMPKRKKTMTTEEQLEPRSLEQCLGELRRIAADCTRRRTFESIERACQICRDTWSAYYDLFMANSALRHREKVERLFKT